MSAYLKRADGSVYADPVDPDGDWQAVQGLEIADIAFMYLNVISPQRRIVVGRHEAGHASDHEPFGLPTNPPENQAAKQGARNPVRWRDEPR